MMSGGRWCCDAGKDRVAEQPGKDQADGRHSGRETDGHQADKERLERKQRIHTRQEYASIFFKLLS